MSVTDRHDWVAGIPMESFSGSNASVFTGTFARDYFDTLIRDPENLPASFITGNGGAMLSIISQGPV